MFPLMNTETYRCFPFDCAPEAISVAPGCDPIIMPRRTPGREASGAPKIFGKIEILLLEYLFGLCCALFPTIEKYLVMFAWGWVRRLTTTKIMAIEVEILGTAGPDPPSDKRVWVVTKPRVRP